ncbi:MAG: lppU [Mycobacterium sp.]|nr:lppU [Mycobacterium sp.]
MAVIALVASGCSSAAAADLKVGDCLKVGGPPDRPDVARVECGSTASNFKVISTVQDTDQCPSDADSSYATRSSFSSTGSTVCMDIDWVVAGCMSIDPENGSDPFRVDCSDTSVPHRQRATQILANVANVDQCTTGVGYAYDERQFTVCVEDVP